MRRIGVLVGLHQHEDEARAQAVGDPHLLAVELVVAVVGLLAGRLDGLDVGAQLGLGEAEGGPDLAGRHLRQQSLLLLIGPELHQQVAADEMGIDHPRDRDPPARELLDDHRVGRQIQPHPAVLLGDRDPEQAELLHLLDDRLRELVLVVVVLGLRDDLLVDELPDHLRDGLLVVGLLRVLRGGQCHAVSLPLKRFRGARRIPALWSGALGTPARRRPTGSASACGDATRSTRDRGRGGARGRRGGAGRGGACREAWARASC